VAVLALTRACSSCSKVKGLDRTGLEVRVQAGPAVAKERDDDQTVNTCPERRGPPRRTESERQSLAHLENDRTHHL